MTGSRGVGEPPRLNGFLAALVLGAGAAASLALARWSPLPATDPLRGCVTALPLVASWLALARDGLAPRGDARSAAVELLLLVTWLAAVLARAGLGLVAAERPLAVAFVLLVGAGVGRTLPALLTVLPPDANADVEASGSGRAVTARLFLLALAFYTALLPWATAQRPPDGDEPWYLLTAHSLAQDLDTDLADDYRDRESLRFLDRAIEPQPGDPRGPRGEIYSRHDPLLPAFLAPFYAAAGKHGALFAMALLTAATAAAWWPLAASIWPDHPRARLAQWSVLALAPPLLLYSHQLWVEVPAALLVTLAVLAIRRLAERPARMPWLVLAATLVALPALKLRFAVLAGSLVVLAFFALPRLRRRLTLVGAVGALAAAAFLLHNRRLFGNALRIHDWRELLLYQYPPGWYLSHFFGLFYDVAFGLFAAAPIWMLLIPGTVRALHGRSPATTRLGRDLAVVCLPYLILVASRREWFGGWSPPFRYPLALLPLFALLAVPAWNDLRRPRARAIATALALATLVVTLVVVASPGLAYSFADGRSRLLDAWSARVGLDLATLVPSGVRVRPATWWVPLGATAALLALWPWRATVSRGGLPHRAERAAPVAAPLAGALALLGAALALPVLAGSITTTRVEIESPHVRKSAGQPDPDPWMFDRRRFPEAWVLPEGASAEARVRAGGELVELRVKGRAIVNHPGTLALHLACGDRLLVRLPFTRHDVWEERAAGPVPWQPGCTLVARVPDVVDRPRGVSSGIAIDSIELRWR